MERDRCFLNDCCSLTAGSVHVWTRFAGNKGQVFWLVNQGVRILCGGGGKGQLGFSEQFKYGKFGKFSHRKLGLVLGCALGSNGCRFDEKAKGICRGKGLGLLWVEFGEF